MKRLPVAIVLVVVLALVWPLGNRAVSSPADTGRLRVATFNIHKGATRQWDYNLERTIEALYRLDADVIGLQEVMRNTFALNCDDQAARLAEGLRHRTGRPWTYVHETAVVTDKRECLRAGRGDGVETEGLAILSAEPIIAADTVRLGEFRIALSVRIASLPGVPVVVTHLSPNADNAPTRRAELSTLLPWLARQGPGILMGDLNARPDAAELIPVLGHYRDGWWDAAAVGRVSGVTSGSTRPGRRVSRIDYVLYAPQVHLRVESAEVLDAGDMPGVGEVSDHHPVAVTFRRKTASS